MRNRRKKEAERKILNLVYGSRPVFEIENSEQPDFLGKLAPNDRPFGIEVTEFFQSESRARLDRIPGYVGELLDGENFRHRIDREQLTVGKGQILSEQKEVVVSELPMIIQRVPPLPECASMVAEVIRSKGKKLAPAFDQLRHVNLIICDRTNLLCNRQPSDFYSIYCTELLRDTLFRSRFREVYFVTRFSRDTVFIPLKMVVTLAYLYFFNAVARSADFPINIGSVSDFMQCFASYLSSIAVGEVQIRRDGDEIEVIYGDTGFILSADLTPQLRQYLDAPKKAGATAGPAVMSDPGIADRMRIFQRENTFSTGIAFRTTSGAYAGG